MNLNQYRVERSNGEGQTFKTAFGRPKTLAQCSDVLIDVILPALEQLLLHSPEILLAALLALAYVLGFAEWAGTWLCDKVVTIR